jgi:hypothetical protein
MPDHQQQAFVDVNPPNTPNKDFDTEPADNKINATAVGISNGGVFDAVNW